MKQRDNNIALTFVNYNSAFSQFYTNYKDQCISISEKTKIEELTEIRQIISTFIYEYDYTITKKSKTIYYRDKLKELKAEMQEDNEIVIIFNKDNTKTTNIIQYKKKYYYYFLSYLNLLGKYVSELTSTFMPNTNIQKKLLRFSNNQIFFEKFTEHKKEVMLALSEFNIHKFSKTYNKLITFYHAYRLFINKEDQIIIEKLFSIILSIYLSKNCLNLLKGDYLSRTQALILTNIEGRINNALLFTNSKMNQSFSNYDVLPKLQEKVYRDRTLI